MSKAFTKESDSDLDDDFEEQPSPVPQGAKNYITPKGAARLQRELHELRTKTRPEVTATVAWAAGNGDRSENADYQYGKRKLREIDRRIHFLQKRLQSAEVVDPTQNESDQVFFGATVTICDEDDKKKTYSIVGVDEIDLNRGRISWLSPLANALMKARVGDFVTVRAPKGNQDVEIIEIRYVAIDD